ncbi:MAG: SusD/RagB family nutrient-binding outer membrane lipoprotein [Bacteroidales bacterium]|nr:SusD/RagB family nutrient-binding outer membrane lipoprotein [Bacteroidales bacterium]
MKRIYFNIMLVFGALLLTVACTKDWEELNVNPNDPVDVPMTNLLANSIRYSGDQFFDDWQGMNNFLSYSGHITKIAYIDEARYNYRPGVVETAFADYYRIQQDLGKMMDMAKADGKYHSEAVALTFSVYLWQMAVDQWGDIPYSEALRAEGEEEILTPAYDKAEDIYADLFVKIEAANTLFNKPVNEANPDEIGAGDFIYGGDITKWQKFANSIHLRLAIRTQNAAEAQKVLNDATGHPVFESNDDEAKFKWQGTAPYKEPWAENHEGRDDHGMAKTMIDMLIALDDPRIDVYAIPNEAGEYVGAPEGAENGAFNVNDISRIGEKYRDDPAGFTYFLRYSEVEFIKAEAAVLGWGGDAQASYEAGIAASFEETGKTEDDLAGYMATPAVDWADLSVYDASKKVYLQKWLALFKQGQELWAENRRTDFPVMNAAAGSMFPGHNRQPFRYPYPDNEFTLNGSSIAPAAAGIVDHFWGKQLFWDKRTGVN